VTILHERNTYLHLLRKIFYDRVPYLWLKYMRTHELVVDNLDMLILT